MFERIVAGVTREGTARSVGRQAVALANSLGAELHLVSCFDATEMAERPVEQHLQGLLDALAESADGKVITHVIPKDPVDTILEVAERCDADLIVVGDKGMHGARRVRSSVPKAIAQHASCAVLILPTSDR